MPTSPAGGPGLAYAVRTAVGPRVIGGIYRRSGQIHRVVGLHYGADAQTVLGRETWAVTDRGTDGVLRTHADPWTPDEMCLARPVHGEPGEHPMAFGISYAGAAVPPLYARITAARAHITALVHRTEPGAVLLWLPAPGTDDDDPDAPAEAHVYRPGLQPAPTSYWVLPQDLHQEYDPIKNI